jgi:aminocarboxymuconate-semialdehyde decarboxylase
MLIDIHAHVIPREFPPAGERDGWPAMEPTDAEDARLLVAGQVRYTARDAWYAAERRLAAMDEHAVDAEVVSPMPPLLNYTLPAKDGLDLCRWINDFVAGLCAAEPRRFFGLGTVPLQAPDLAAAELAGIREAGLHGVEMASNVDGRPLDDDRYLDFFREAARLQVPVFVHALPTLGRLPRAALPTFAVGVEGALAAAAIVSGGVAEHCPDLRLAFSHGAGGFPLELPRAQRFWGGTWNEEPRPAGQPAPPGQAPHSPARLARRFWYDTLVFDRRAVRYLVDMLGADRLLVGSDFPAMPREQPAGRTLRSLGLPAAALEDITWNNAFRFLGIEPPASC